jgi:two-component system chemotaxis response regulator CheY
MNNGSPNWPSDPKQVRILIADDDPMIRKLVKATLLKLEHSNIIEATSGEETLEICRKRWPNLLFLDIQMGGQIDGMAVLNELRAVTRPLYVIMITAHGTIQNVRQAVSNNVNGFLVKPLNSERICQALENYHGMHR